MKQVHDFLKETGIYYLATEDGNQPRVRVFDTINIFEEKLYIKTAKSKDVFSQLISNPKAEICAYKDGKWVRLMGELIEDDREEARKAMLDAYPELRASCNENDGNTTVFYWKNATATFSSFSEDDTVVKF